MSRFVKKKKSSDNTLQINLPFDEGRSSYVKKRD